MDTESYVDNSYRKKNNGSKKISVLKLFPSSYERSMGKNRILNLRGTRVDFSSTWKKKN